MVLYRYHGVLEFGKIFLRWYYVKLHGTVPSEIGIKRDVCFGHLPATLSIILFFNFRGAM